MNYVFLILVLATSHSTTNITTPMPNMEVCERMLDYHLNDLPMSPTFDRGGISKPRYGYCKEITVDDIKTVNKNRK